MKKTVAALLITALALCLASCAKTPSAEQVSEQAADTTREDSGSSASDYLFEAYGVDRLSEEDFSDEIVEPSYDVPLTLSECAEYLGDGAQTQTDGDGKITKIESFDSSGNLTADASYAYENGETLVTVQYYGDGVDATLGFSEKFIFKYDSNGRIYELNRAFFENEYGLAMEAYTFSPDGTIKGFISKDTINQAILGAVFDALGEGLS